MKLVLGLLAVGTLFAPAWPVAAQGLPPGTYLQQCRDVRMEGQFLHAWCRGPQGSGNSSINVLSCPSGIGVAPDGALVCSGLGPAPGPYPPTTRPYPPPGEGGYYPPPGGYGRWSATIYDRFGFRGRAIRLRDEMPNLDRTGLNDRVASIRLGRRTGPWLVCSDANYRGRCVTVGSDIGDTGQLGMLNSISSMRPLRDERPYPQPR
jgi:hypothetical protein